MEGAQAERRGVADDMELVAFLGQPDRQFRGHDPAPAVGRIADDADFHGRPHGIVQQVFRTEERDRVVHFQGFPDEKRLPVFHPDLGAVSPVPGLDVVQEFGPADERFPAERAGADRGLIGTMELGGIGPDRVHFLGVGVGDIDDERRRELEAALAENDLHRPERLLARLDFFQPGEIGRGAHELGRVFVIRVAVDPIGGEDDPGPMGADLGDDLELVLPGDLDPAVGDVEHLVGRQAHHLGRMRRTPGPGSRRCPGCPSRPGSGR